MRGYYIKAVFFDFNGVIADDERLHWKLFNEIVSRFNISVSFKDYLDKFLGLNDIDAFSLILKNAGNKLSKKELGELVREKASFYQKKAPSCTSVYKSTLRFLKTIPKNLIVGIVSGALREEIKVFLNLYDLTHTFHFIIAAEDTYKGKPNPEGYQKAFDKAFTLSASINLKPYECLSIEDSKEGILAAKFAGLKTLGLMHTYCANHIKDADIILPHLARFTFKDIDLLIK